MKPSPVFILGAQRSGTTMLRLMMDSHANLAIPFETDFILPYYDRLEEFGDLGEDDALRRLIAEILANPFIAKGEMKDVPPEAVFDNVEDRTYAGVVDAFFGTWARSRGKGRWGDKNPGSHHIHIYDQLFPDARFLHLIRDGRDVAASRLRLKTWGSDSVLYMAHHWCWNVTFIRSVGRQLGDRYHELKYEDLVRDPEGELRSVCDWLGEPYDPAMAAFDDTASSRMPADLVTDEHKHSVRRPDPSKIGMGMRQMRRGDRALFQTVAKGLLEDLGYELEPAGSFGYRLSRKLAEVRHAVRGRTAFSFPGQDYWR